jgi:hypothetical protein
MFTSSSMMVKGLLCYTVHRAGSQAGTTSLSTSSQPLSDCIALHLIVCMNHFIAFTGTSEI